MSRVFNLVLNQVFEIQSYLCLNCFVQEVYINGWLYEYYVIVRVVSYTNKEDMQREITFLKVMIHL